MADSAEQRLVLCSRCGNVLRELSDYSVYQCGSCGAVLQAKPENYGSGSLSENSDEGKIGGDSAKSENLLEKGVVDSSDAYGDVSDIKVKSNSGSSRYNVRIQSVETDEIGIFENGLDVNRNRDAVDKLIGREQEGPKSQIGPEKRSKFSRRMSNWQNGERAEMEGFWRKPRADIEGVGFSVSNYPDEGTSNSYSSVSYNYRESWRNYKEVDGANRVQHLEQDRAELLRKLDEIKDQLSQSSDMVNNPKEKVRLDGRVIPPDPHGGSDAWLPDGSSGLNRTSRQFFSPAKHAVGPSYFNYHHDQFAYSNSHEMAMPNFYPSMHKPNYIPGYGDPFASQRRGPHQLPHQIPQQSFHPYYPGHFVGTDPDSYETYAHNAMLHPPSCSCFHCYQNKRRVPAPVPPAAFINSRFPDTPNDHMLYHHDIPGTYGPQVHNSRSTTPSVNFHERQSQTRWPNDFNSEMAGFVQSRFRKVMLTNGSRHCRAIAGGSPFITCYNCFELLQLPKKALFMMKSHQQKVRCGTCSSEISCSVINKKLIISPYSEVKRISTSFDDSSNEVVDSCVSHSNGHVIRSGANFSSDDYSGYDFHSADREPNLLAADPSLNCSKSQEMQSFHSSSPSATEGENSSEVASAPRESTKSIQQPTKASLSPPPIGSPLQEYFDYSNNNHAVNRFEKGNQSSRSEQEKAKIDNITSRQNSLKEAALATEMDVHDYSNTGVSQDSGDVSREHDHPISNKGSESFFANIIKKSNRDLSRSNPIDEHEESSVTVNGQPIPDSVIKKAEKLAGPIQPGNYWYDFRAGFWGVMGGPCLGIIPPSIEEFNHPMPENCAGGNTGVFVNGRELNQIDLDLLAGRGLPTVRDRSYIIEISGRVMDEDTGEELDSLGKLAPTVLKVKRGFGMKVRRAAA